MYVHVYIRTICIYAHYEHAYVDTECTFVLKRMEAKRKREAGSRSSPPGASAVAGAGPASPAAGPRRPRPGAPLPGGQKRPKRRPATSAFSGLGVFCVFLDRQLLFFFHATVTEKSGNLAIQFFSSFFPGHLLARPYSCLASFKEQALVTRLARYLVWIWSWN